ncbi:aminoglycoside phosphotransferase family protein [Endothiovibrio diazotrophicus]
MPERLAQLQRWLGDELKIRYSDITPASGDASFRRYFRVHRDDDTLIAMDAPPEREDCRPFIQVGGALHAIGLNVPQVLEGDLEQGFLLLSDLGTRQYLPELSETTAGRLYGDALGALAVLQGVGPRDELLPPYDRELLLREMTLFPDWLLERHLGMTLGEGLRGLLDETFEALVRNALEQPQVAVHRDYHSRNLMITGRNNPGILDFQDAVFGPLTYDLVSLLKDAYIAWPRERVEAWVVGYDKLAYQTGVVPERDDERFLRWFDLMGAQRQLKVAGIFARLYHRDGKAGYLKDIPRTLGYLVEIAPRYPEIAELGRFIEREVLPAL